LKKANVCCFFVKTQNAPRSSSGLLSAFLHSFLMLTSLTIRERSKLALLHGLLSLCVRFLLVVPLSAAYDTLFTCTIQPLHVARVISVNITRIPSFL
jgi:hypothetical protein